MELAIQLLVTIVGGVVTALLGYLTHGWWTRRIRVERIVSPNDPNLEKMCKLHEALFREEVRDSCDDITRWLEEMEVKRRDSKNRMQYEEYVLVAKHGIDVVGYLFAQYYNYSKYFFISYLGIDKDDKEVITEIAPALIRKLIKFAKNKHPKFRGLVAELETEKAAGQMRCFRLHAKNAGFEGYEVELPYKQPSLSPSQDLSLIPQVLIYFTRDDRIRRGRVLTKCEALEIIRFVYIEVYGDSYEDDAELDRKYRDYLAELYNQYEKTLPDAVPLRPLGQRPKTSTRAGGQSSTIPLALESLPPP